MEYYNRINYSRNQLNVTQPYDYMSLLLMEDNETLRTIFKTFMQIV